MAGYENLGEVFLRGEGWDRTGDQALANNMLGRGAAPPLSHWLLGGAADMGDAGSDI